MLSNKMAEDQMQMSDMIHQGITFLLTCNPRLGLQEIMGQASVGTAKRSHLCVQWPDATKRESEIRQEGQRVGFCQQHSVM